MDDKHFYNFKKSMEHERDIPFDQEAWDSLNQRLDAQNEQPVRRLFSPWMLAAAALVPLVFGYVFLYNSLNKSHELNHKLMTQLEELTSKEEATKRDTVFEKEYIVVRDTIVLKDKFIQKTTQNVVTSAFVQNPFFTPSAIELQTPNSINDPNISNPYLAENLGTLLMKKRERDLQVQKEELANKTLNALPFKDFKHLSTTKPLLSDYLVETEPFISNENKRHSLKALFFPKGFLIGMNAGGALSLPMQNDLQSDLRYVVGLRTAVDFYGNRRLWADFSYRKWLYQTETMDEKIGIPVVASPGDNFEFEEAHAQRNVYAATIGVQQFFKSKGKFRPFGNLGYGLMWVPPHEIAYSFIDTVADEEEIDDIAYNQSTLIKNIIHVGLGGEYELNRHWRLGIEGFYRMQLTEHERFSNSNYLSLAGTISYQF